MLPDKILKYKFSNLDGAEIVVFKFIPSVSLFCFSEQVSSQALIQECAFIKRRLQKLELKVIKLKRRRVDYIMP